MENRSSYVYTIAILSAIFLQADSFKRIINDQSEFETDIKIKVPQNHPNERQKRRSPSGLPSEMTIELTLKEKDVVLNLKRNYHITNKVPVTVERHGKIIPQHLNESQEIGYYFDIKNGSAFMVQKARRTKSPNEFEFFGATHIGSHKYLVQPPDDNYKTHSLIRMPTKKSVHRDYIPVPQSEKRVTSELIQKEKHTMHDRHKRYSQTYEIEILMVVDFSIYSFWKDREATGLSITEVDANAKINMRQYYALMLNEIDLIYKSVVGRGYEIRLLFAGLHVADNVREAAWTETIKNTSASSAWVNSTDALKKFKLWIKDSKLPGHDHAVLLTRYQFEENETANTYVAGRAYLPGLCGERRVSVVMDRFEADATNTAAHELGHNLNAHHDGDNNICSEDEGYVMAAVKHIWKNATVNKKLWTFSNCSLHYFDAFIVKLNSENSNCMLTRSTSYTDSTLNEFDGELRGQIYPPDDQCASQNGNNSYLCRDFLNWDYSRICSEMYCTKYGINNGTCWRNLPFSGTSCGNGKLCSRGSCISSHLAPSGMIETCLFGDQPGIVPFLNKTCQSLSLEVFQYHCYDEYYRERCCDTCRQVAELYVSLRGCKYGDHSPDCDISQCHNYDEHSRSFICCKTCSGTTSTKTTTTTSRSTTASTSPSTTTAKPTPTPTTTSSQKTTTTTLSSSTAFSTTRSKRPSTTTTRSPTTTPTPFTQLAESFRPITPLPEGFKSRSSQLPNGFKPITPLPNGFQSTTPLTKDLPKGFQAIPPIP